MTARLGRMLRGCAEDLSEYLVVYPMPLPKGACIIRDEVNANLPRSLLAWDSWLRHRPPGASRSCGTFLTPG
jgi:hypothetical protein